MRITDYSLYTHAVCKIALQKKITHLFPPQGNFDVVTQILPMFPIALKLSDTDLTLPRMCTHLPLHAAMDLVYTAGRQLNPSYCHLDASFTSLPSHSIFLNKHTERLSSKPSTPTPPFPRSASESLNIFKENK